MKKRLVLFVSFLIMITFSDYSYKVIAEEKTSDTIAASKHRSISKAQKKLKNGQPTYRVGVALSGGGIKGMCHAGVLKALEEYGIQPDVISGVSAGAVVATLYADGYTPEEICAFFGDVSFTKLTNLKLSEGGFFSMKSFEKFLGEKLRAKTFEELPFALRIVTTNLDKGESVAFSSGDLLPPVVASCSMPVLFAPRMIDGAAYVDGGVLRNFPVSTIRDECEFVIGVSCSPMIVGDYKKNVVSIASRSYRFMFRANARFEKEMCDILIEPEELVDYDTFDVEKSKEIFELGYKTTVEMLESEAGREFLALLRAK